MTATLGLTNLTFKREQLANGHRLWTFKSPAFRDISFALTANEEAAIIQFLIFVNTVTDPNKQITFPKDQP